MYFIGLLIMTSGESGGGSNIMSSWEGFGHSCPMCPRNLVEDISSSLGARELGMEQPGTPDSDTAPASSALAQQLPSLGPIAQLGK